MTLQSRFFTSQRVRLWFSVVMVLSIVVTATAYFVVPWYASRTFADPVRERTRLDGQSYLSSYLEDQKLLAGTYLPVTASNKRDAGPVLNSKIVWSEREGEDAAKLLALPPGLLADLRAWKNNWPAMADSVSWQQLDFSWMVGLKKFDHWDIHRECDGCVHSEVRSRGIDKYLTPKFEHLLGWAKLRLLQGLRTKDTLKAATEVRQLASLIISQEMLASAMVGQAMFKLERIAYDFAVRNKVSVDPRWQPLSMETLERARRACWTTGTLFNPAHSEEVLHTVFSSDQKRYCKCSGLAEGVFVWSMFGSAMRTAVDARQERVMTEIVRTSDCRLHPFRAEWDRVTFVPSAETRIPLNPLPKPINKIVGSVLMAIGSPDAWRLYKSSSESDSDTVPVH